MTDEHIRCVSDAPHEPHMVDLGFVDYDCPGVPITACRAEYELPGVRDHGDRIVRCQLDAGHTGAHVETDTGSTWPPADPPRMAQRIPDTAGRCGVFPPQHLWPGQAPWADAQACVLPAGHPGWHHDEHGQEWSRELLAELTTAGLTAEQDIRARALTVAAAIMDVALIDEAHEAADVALEVAEKLATYIATGVIAEPVYRLVEPDEPPTPTSSTVEAP